MDSNGIRTADFIQIGDDGSLIIKSKTEQKSRERTPDRVARYDKKQIFSIEDSGELTLTDRTIQFSSSTNNSLVHGYEITETHRYDKEGMEIQLKRVSDAREYTDEKGVIHTFADIPIELQDNLLPIIEETFTREDGGKLRGDKTEYPRGNNSADKPKQHESKVVPWMEPDLDNPYESGDIFQKNGLDNYDSLEYQANIYAMRDLLLEEQEKSKETTQSVDIEEQIDAMRKKLLDETFPQEQEGMVQSSNIQNQGKDRNVPVVRKSKFAQIYGKAKGRIQSIYEKIKSFMHSKDNTRQDDINKDNDEGR